jgi:hypothetical protein
MKYFVVQPEVAGGLGTNTVIDRSVHPPAVSKLHHHFEGWLGDGLLKSFPCFIATDGVRNTLVALKATGVEFDDVEITTSEQFQDVQPDCQLPEFVWLRITGKPGRDDLGVNSDARLVVSERVMNALQDDELSHARLGEFAT